MLFNDYIKNHDFNILSLSKLCGIPYATLHNGIENPSSLKADNLFRLSAQLSLSMEEVFTMLHESSARHELLSLLLKQQKDRKGLYAFTQTELAFHSGVLDGCSLSIEEVLSIFETGRLEGSFKAGDIVFVYSCFNVFDEMLCEADMLLSLQMIEKYALMTACRPLSQTQKSGISDLLSHFNPINKVSFSDILKLHVDIVGITNSGALARMLSFKECLRAGIVPFIIDSDYKAFYERGIEKYKADSTFLSDICLRMQENYAEKISEYKDKAATRPAV